MCFDCEMYSKHNKKKEVNRKFVETKTGLKKALTLHETMLNKRAVLNEMWLFFG